MLAGRTQRNIMDIVLQTEKATEFYLSQLGCLNLILSAGFITTGFLKKSTIFSYFFQIKQHLSSLLRTDRARVPCYNKVIK